jgi:D-alanyl-D-alanine carboxypeptidase
VLVILVAPDLALAPMPQTLGLRTVPRPAPPPAAAIQVSPSAIDAPRYPAALDAARAVAGANRVTFAVVLDGRIAWSGSSGAGTRADTPLVIGSVTKTFVAATVLALVSDGRLDLESQVGDLLPPYPGVPGSVTVRQLLDHTSGIADVFNPITSAALEAEPDRAWTARRLFATVEPPWHPPGDGWSYANANYYLLGLIVERVTGASLTDELQRRYLGPLDLGSTRMLSAERPEPLSAAWATIFWASGAMVSSAADLARWGDALYGGGILAPSMLEAMLSFNADDYGLGAQRIVMGGRSGVGHTGLLDTYTTLLLHVPDDGVTIAMLVDRPEAPLAAMLSASPAGGGPSLWELALEH